MYFVDRNVMQNLGGNGDANVRKWRYTAAHRCELLFRERGMRQLAIFPPRGSFACGVAATMPGRLWMIRTSSLRSGLRP